MLQESEIHFEVLQEYSPGARAERIALGNIKLNLSEYVDGGDDGEDSITRRYLMQESKINSTLKVCNSTPVVNAWVEKEADVWTDQHPDATDRGRAKFCGPSAEERSSLWWNSRHHGNGVDRR